METKEKNLEQDIESYLLNEGGYVKGNMWTYDKRKATDMPVLIEFIEKTQPKQWEKYKNIYGEQESATNHEISLLIQNVTKRNRSDGRSIVGVEATPTGDGVVKQLADYIEKNSPEVKGFSDKNLWRMKQFYETYKDVDEKLSPLVRQISWTNNLTIMSRSETS